MKKKLLLLIIFLMVVFMFTGCSTNENDNVISKEPEPNSINTSSEQVSFQTSSQETSTILSSDKMISSALPTSDVLRTDGVKKVSVTSGNALQDEYKIDYPLSITEIEKFINLYNKLELEYVEPYGVDKRGITIPGAGSMCPCEITIEYSNGKETKWIDVPEFTSEHKKYKATSGAKELLEFLSNLDCYKKEKIDLYDMWLNEKSE